MTHGTCTVVLTFCLVLMENFYSMLLLFFSHTVYSRASVSAKRGLGDLVICITII